MTVIVQIGDGYTLTANDPTYDPGFGMAPIFTEDFGIDPGGAAYMDTVGEIPEREQAQIGVDPGGAMVVVKP